MVDPKTLIARAIRTPLAALVALATILAPTATAAGSYTVRPNDTLSGIASQHGTSAADLIQLNSLSDPDRLAVGQTLRIPTKPPKDIEYTVQKGDVLSTIASRHGTRTDTLVRYNRLASPDRLQVGDVLRIPLASDSSSAPALPPSLERELATIRVRGGRWQHIVIHHSATDQGTLEGIDNYHRRNRRMENGLAYHFVIGNGRGIPDGQIEVGDRWRKQLDGGHMASTRLNRDSIGICLVGNFMDRKPTAKQMESLQALSTYLTRRCRLDKARLKVHRQLNTKPTDCPGKHFPLASFLRDFQP